MNITMTPDEAKLQMRKNAEKIGELNKFKRNNQEALIRLHNESINLNNELKKDNLKISVFQVAGMLLNIENALRKK